MSIESRLDALERLPPQRASKPKPTNRELEKLAIEQRIRETLHLPLPAQATDDELAEGLRLFKAAVRSQHDRSGWAASVEYNQGLHRKYAD